MSETETKLLAIKGIANNSLCLDDSSDYGNALWDILKTIDPNMDEDLKFID